jgi:ribosomal protein S27AE
MLLEIFGLRDVCKLWGCGSLRAGLRSGCFTRVNLDALIVHVGKKDAVKLCSTNSFMSRHEEARVVLDALIEHVGKKDAVSLCSTGSFMSRHEEARVVLDALIEHVGKKDAVSL